MQFGSSTSELALSIKLWPIPAPDLGFQPLSVVMVGGGCLFVRTRESGLLTMRVGVGVAVVVTVVSSSALSPSRSPAMSPSESPSDSPVVPA